MVKTILLEDRVYNQSEHRQTGKRLSIAYLLAVLGVIYLNLLVYGIRFIADFYFGLEKEFWLDYLKHHPAIVMLNESLLMAVTSRLSHSAKAENEQPQAVGLSRGGTIRKMHLAVDSYGLPIEFIITGEEVHDSKATNELIELLPQGDFVVADKGYDSEEFNTRDSKKEKFTLR
jgi:hypothetical protein